MKYTQSISVVVPIYNDQEVIAELHRRLRPVLEAITDRYALLLVDDGSRDRSREEMLKVRQANEHVQQSAIAAGLSLTSNDLIVLMDSDLQDRPEDIPTLIDALLADPQAMMAIAQWEERKDSRMKLAVSRLFQRVSNSITEIHTVPRLGIFRVMKKSVVEELRNSPGEALTAVSVRLYRQPLRGRTAQTGRTVCRQERL